MDEGASLLISIPAARGGVRRGLAENVFFFALLSVGDESLSRDFLDDGRGFVSTATRLERRCRRALDIVSQRYIRDCGRASCRSQAGGIVVPKAAPRRDSVKGIIFRRGEIPSLSLSRHTRDSGIVGQVDSRARPAAFFFFSENTIRRTRRSRA